MAGKASSTANNKYAGTSKASRPANGKIAGAGKAGSTGPKGK